MYERGKSDRLVVLTKPPKKAMAAEVVEGRGRGEGNPSGTTRPGHRAGSGVPHVPDRVRRTGAGESGALVTSRLGVGPCDARPEPGAQCGSSARWDLRGGPPAKAVPTATIALDVAEVLAIASTSDGNPLQDHPDSRRSRAVGDANAVCHYRTLGGLVRRGSRAAGGIGEFRLVRGSPASWLGRRRTVVRRADVAGRVDAGASEGD
jgi:hypothetical protein